MNKLEELRKQAGLTQQELANKSGISRQHLSNIENGKVEPGMTIAINICKSLNITIDILQRLLNK